MLLLSDCMDGRPPGSSVHGIFQARILEWVAVPFSRASSWSRDLNPCLLHCRWILYCWATRKVLNYTHSNIKSTTVTIFSNPWWLSGKESACNAGDWGLIPGLGRSPGEGSGNPLQYSCLENPMDREAWGATVHEVTKSRTRLSD